MLSPAALRSSLADLFRPESMPAGDVKSAVAGWISRYAVYAQSANAGPAILTAPLVAPAPVGSDFVSALDSSLRAMWMAAVWAGPGVVGTTAVVPPVGPSLLANSGILIDSSDPQQAVSLIADSIHTYTLSITVTLVPVTGTPTVVPLT